VNLHGGEGICGKREHDEGKPSRNPGRGGDRGIARNLRFSFRLKLAC